MSDFHDLLFRITKTAWSIRDTAGTLDFAIDRGWDARDPDQYEKYLKEYNDGIVELKKLIEDIQSENNEDWFEYLNNSITRLSEIKEIPPGTINISLYVIPETINELKKLLNNQFNDIGSARALSIAEEIIKAVR